jgi:hypothetical protein
MSAPTDDLWQVKTGTAALAVCIVRTLQKSDPDFEDRFLKNLDRAYDHFRHDHGATRRDGSPRATSWSKLDNDGELCGRQRGARLLMMR